jgi:hypothetical protein
MPVIESPDGSNAILREDLSARGRRVLTPVWTDFVNVLTKQFPNLADFKELDLTDEAVSVRLALGSDGRFIGVSMDLQAAAIVAYLRAWSRGPLPTLETVWDIEPIEFFDALAAAASKLAIRDMGVGEGEFGPSGHDDPNSPTEPSSDSRHGGEGQSLHSTSQTGKLSSKSESGSSEKSSTSRTKSTKKNQTV